MVVSGAVSAALLLLFVMSGVSASSRSFDSGDHCGHWGFTKNCTDHNCSVCQLKWQLPPFVPLQRLCVKNSTADHIKMMYDCCSGGSGPAPGPEPTPPHAGQEDSCAKRFGHADCTADPLCVWCESRAVPSQCYAREDAGSLPAGIFACADDLPEPFK
jgi:hypothetical protein